MEEILILDEDQVRKVSRNFLLKMKEKNVKGGRLIGCCFLMTSTNSANTTQLVEGVVSCL